MSNPAIWIAIAAGYLLTWALIPWVLLKRTVHASAAVAWILCIIFLPYLGALLCLIFGTTRWEKHRTRKREAADRIDRQVPQWSEAAIATGDELGAWQPLGRLAANLTGARVTSGNDVQIIPSTQRSLEVLLEMLEAAEHWIHIEFYIWRADEAGERVHDVLIRKARQGVPVRLLYDGFGSILLGRKYLRSLKHAGVQVASFTPGLQFWHLLSLNLRNHRKIVVVDGRAAFTGGMNIGDEYVHHTKGFGDWRDTQLVVRGPAVAQFQQVFAQDWYYAAGEPLTDPAFFPEPGRPGDVPAQVVADGPDDDVDVVYSLLMAATGLAQERITLSTPYFVPPNGLAMALQTAARRGVRVRLMIADRGNFAITLNAGRSYYEKLLDAGVEIFEYEKGLFHPKVFVADGQWALVGTPNFDFRSLILNFEVALAIFASGTAAELEREFEEDLQFARRINLDEWRKRSKWVALRQQFWRLFAPML